jgi:hypothetical protein
MLFMDIIFFRLLSVSLSNIREAFMVSTDSQKPVCPVCHQADQVQTLQQAYESGIQRFARPVMPVGRVPMMKTMAIGVLITTIASFLIIVLLGPGQALPDWIRIIQVVITILAIVAVLVISFMAFIRITQGDIQSQHLLPAWDNALANWSRLRYCKRDNIVFDPQQPNKALSDQEVNSLLTVEAPSGQSDEVGTKIAQRA